MNTWRDISPQGVGILPSYLSLLILPYVKNWEKYIDKVLKLDFSEIPEEWEFFKHVYKGDKETAIKKLEDIEEENVKIYNLSVLTGKITDTVKDNFLRFILNYLHGNKESIDEYIEKEEKKELKALLLLIKARDIYRFNRSEALKLIDRAIAEVSGLSPLFHANLLLLKAKIIQERGINYPLLQLYLEIEKIVKDTYADFIKAEVNYQVGNILLAFGNTEEAIKHLHKALEFYTKERDSYTYALINNSLGLAYVSQPPVSQEDQIRLALGVQHFKKALEVFTKESYPEEWASTSLNYANALIYLPTYNPAKNINKAIEIYKEVLEYRRKKGPKESLARVLANLGNALAHIGKFEEAQKYLKEAKSIFLSCKMEEEVRAIEEILSEIEAVKGGVYNENEKP